MLTGYLHFFFGRLLVPSTCFFRLNLDFKKLIYKSSFLLYSYYLNPLWGIAMLKILFLIVFLSSFFGEFVCLFVCFGGTLYFWVFTLCLARYSPTQDHKQGFSSNASMTWILTLNIWSLLELFKCRQWDLALFFHKWPSAPYWIIHFLLPNLKCFLYHKSNSCVPAFISALWFFPFSVCLPLY